MAKVTIEDFQLKGFQQLAKTMDLLMRSPQAKQIVAAALQQVKSQPQQGAAPSQASMPQRPPMAPPGRPAGPPMPTRPMPRTR